MKKPAFLASVVGLLLGGFFVFLGNGAFAQTNYQVPNDNQPSNTDNTQQTPQPSQQSTNQNNVVIKTSNTQDLGKFLVNGNGMTLYTFLNDSNGNSTCNGECAQIWMPLTVNQGSSINISSDANGKIGTITRSDGTLQVTYNSMPLYTYNKDTKAGDTNGQGAAGLWFVAKA